MVTLKLGWGDILKFALEYTTEEMWASHRTMSDPKSRPNIMLAQGSSSLFLNFNIRIKIASLWSSKNCVGWYKIRDLVLSMQHWGCYDYPESTWKLSLSIAARGMVNRTVEPLSSWDSQPTYIFESQVHLKTCPKVPHTCTQPQKNADLKHVCRS